MTNADQYAEFAQPQLGDNILAQIAQTAREIIEAQADIEAKQAEVAAAQAHHRMLVEERMPELMAVAGQEQLTTIDGLVVKVGQIVRASIPKAFIGQAVKWLRDNGQGGVVKNQISVELGRGEDERAQTALKALEGLGLDPAAKISVNSQTLSALIRELLAEGKEVPLDILGAHVTRQAVVKPKPIK